jgi:oxalate---CoA ligase
MNPFDVPPGLASVARAIRVQVDARPDAPAILAPGRTPLTYAGLWRQIERTVGALREFGVGPADRVALVLPNGPEMAVALVAAICGAVAAPLNPGLGAAEFEASLADLRAKAIVVPAGSDSAVRAVAAARGLPLIELAANLDAPAGAFSLAGYRKEPSIASPLDGLVTDSDADTRREALILQTSGTTARPKTFVLSQSLATLRMIEKVRVTRLTEADRCLNLMPLFHTGAIFNAVLASLAVGGSVVCAPGLAVQNFFEWVDVWRPSWYLGTPAIHQAIVTEASRHHEAVVGCPLRFVRCISSALSPQLRSEVESVFNAPVIESYALTETEILSFSPPPP